MKVVVFDLDDTLYKEDDYVLSAYAEIARCLSVEKGLNRNEIINILNGSRESGENPFDNLLKRYNVITIEDLLVIYRYHLPDINLPKDSIKLLEKLKGNVVIGLITDGRSITQRNKIKALGLEAYIEDENIIISEEFGSEKTDVSNYLFFCNKYPDNNVFYYIGDNLKKDFVNANSLGWTTIQLIDNGRNIHSQEVEVHENYLPQYKVHNIFDAYEIIMKEN